MFEDMCLRLKRKVKRVNVIDVGEFSVYALVEFEERKRVEVIEKTTPRI